MMNSRRSLRVRAACSLARFASCFIACWLAGWLADLLAGLLAGLLGKMLAGSLDPWVPTLASVFFCFAGCK